MRCLYLTFIIAIMLASNSFALLCNILNNCDGERSPYKGDSYYIGFTDEDCRNMYVCKRKRNDICMPEINKTKNGIKCNYPTVYDDCYGRNGVKKSDWIDPNTVSFLNPWDSKVGCRWSYKKVNIKNNKCYSSSSNNNVISSNKSTRTARSLSRINGRCLTPDGWCDC